MMRHLCLLMIVSAGLLSPGRAGASESPLEAIPEGAGVVLRFRSPQVSMQKLAVLAGKLDPQHGQAVQGATPMLGNLISNPGLQGVDASSDWWVAVYPHADGDPGVVFVVPASDADALEAAVRKAGDYEFVRHDKWVLYTEHAAAAQALSGRAAGKGGAISGAIGEQSLAIMDGAELSAFVNVPVLRTTYRAQIDRARRGIEGFLNQLSNLPVQRQGVDMRPIVDMYAGLLRGLVQGLNDAEGLTVGVVVRENGIALEELVRFASESKSAEFLGSHEPSELKRLGALPADHLAYFGGRFDMQAMLSWSMQFSVGMFQNDPQKQQQLRELIAEYGKLTYGDFAGSFDLGDSEGGLYRGIYLWEVEPAGKMRELAQAFAEQMKLPTRPGVTMEIDYQAGAEKYGERTADVMTMKQTFDPSLDPMGMQQRMMDALFGPEGMVARSVYLEGAVLQTQGGGRELMTEALQALDDGGTALAGAAGATRGQLSDKANLCVLFDVPGIAAEGFVAFARSGAVPVPVDPAPVEQLELPRSYAGFSVTTEQRGLRCQAYVPVEQAQGMLALLQAFQSMRQQP